MGAPQIYNSTPGTGKPIHISL